MSSHQTKIIGDTGAWQAKCSCKMRSPVVDHRWKADDWSDAHLRAVERTRTYLRGTPSLTDQRDWYRDQASRATDETIREQWRNLAEGLDHRLGTGPAHDDPLF